MGILSGSFGLAGYRALRTPALGSMIGLIGTELSFEMGSCLPGYADEGT